MPALANTLLGAVLGDLRISSITSAATSFLLRRDKLYQQKEIEFHFILTLLTLIKDWRTVTFFSQISLILSLVSRFGRSRRR